MKSHKTLTLLQIVLWANKNGISLDTPVYLYAGNREYGFEANGIVYETEMPMVDDLTPDEDACNELKGAHCYCSNTEIPTGVIVITDGIHYYDERVEDK